MCSAVELEVRRWLQGGSSIGGVQIWEGSQAARGSRERKRRKGVSERLRGWGDETLKSEKRLSQRRVTCTSEGVW
eukprot:3206061-Rhodomonas_salina.2